MNISTVRGEHTITLFSSFLDGRVVLLGRERIIRIYMEAM